MSQGQDGLNGTVGLDMAEPQSRGEAPEAALPGGLRRDEVLGLGEGTEFSPAFEGNEASRSTQSFAELVAYTVPSHRYALLDEVAANVASNGEVRIAIPGNDPVDLTGDIDVSVPFDGAVLLPGETVRVLHQSTDGASATQRATITAREV